MQKRFDRYMLILGLVFSISLALITVFPYLLVKAFCWLAYWTVAFWIDIEDGTGFLRNNRQKLVAGLVWLVFALYLLPQSAWTTAPIGILTVIAVVIRLSY